MAFCVFCLESYTKYIVVWVGFLWVYYIGGLQIFCKKVQQLWINILKARVFWSSHLKKGIMAKIQFLWGQKGQELFYSSPQVSSFLQTITNVMKTFKMKGTDQALR